MAAAPPRSASAEYFRGISTRRGRGDPPPRKTSTRYVVAAAPPRPASAEYFRGISTSWPRRRCDPPPRKTSTRNRRYYLDYPRQPLPSFFQPVGAAPVSTPLHAAQLGFWIGEARAVAPGAFPEPRDWRGRPAAPDKTARALLGGGVLDRADGPAPDVALRVAGELAGAAAAVGGVPPLEAAHHQLQAKIFGLAGEGKGGS